MSQKFRKFNFGPQDIFNHYLKEYDVKGFLWVLGGSEELLSAFYESYEGNPTFYCLRRDCSQTVRKFLSAHLGENMYSLSIRFKPRKEYDMKDLIKSGNVDLLTWFDDTSDLSEYTVYAIENAPLEMVEYVLSRSSTKPDIKYLIKFGNLDLLSRSDDNSDLSEYIVYAIENAPLKVLEYVLARSSTRPDPHLAYYAAIRKMDSTFFTLYDNGYKGGFDPFIFLRFNHCSETIYREMKEIIGKDPFIRFIKADDEYSFYNVLLQGYAPQILHVIACIHNKSPACLYRLLYPK